MICPPSNFSSPGNRWLLPRRASCSTSRPHLTAHPATCSYPVKTISCKHPSHDTQYSLRKYGTLITKLAVVALAAWVLTLDSVGGAFTAKTGGRVVGQAFRPSTPRSSGPWNNNSRTNIFIDPPISPPLVGGYGYGSSVPFYGVAPVVRRFVRFRDEEDDY